jgi:hypothetical protein
MEASNDPEDDVVVASEVPGGEGSKNRRSSWRWRKTISVDNHFSLAHMAFDFVKAGCPKSHATQR